jgi:hypothetical protein
MNVEKTRNRTKPKVEESKSSKKNLLPVAAGLGALASLLYLSSGPPEEEIKKPEEVQPPPLPDKNDIDAMMSSLLQSLKNVIDNDNSTDQMYFTSSTTNKETGEIISKIDTLESINTEDLVFMILHNFINSPELLMGMLTPQALKTLRERRLDNLAQAIIEICNTQKIVPYVLISIKDVVNGAYKIDFSPASRLLTPKAYAHFIKLQANTKQILITADNHIKMSPNMELSDSLRNLVLGNLISLVTAYGIFPNTATLYDIALTLVILGESELAVDYVNQFIAAENFHTAMSYSNTAESIIDNVEKYIFSKPVQPAQQTLQFSKGGSGGGGISPNSLKANGSNGTTFTFAPNSIKADQPIIFKTGGIVTDSTSLADGIITEYSTSADPKLAHDDYINKIIAEILGQNVSDKLTVN